MKIKSLLLLSIATLLTLNAFAMEEGMRPNAGQKRSADAASDGQKSKRQRTEDADSAAQEPAEQTATQEHELPLIEQMLPDEIQAHIASYVTHKHPLVDYILERVQEHYKTKLDSRYKQSLFYIDYNPQSDQFFGCYGAAQLHIWEKNNENNNQYRLRPINFPGIEIDYVQLSPDKSKLALACRLKKKGTWQIKIFTLESLKKGVKRKPLYTIDLNDEKSFDSMQWKPTSAEIITITDLSKIKTWDIKNGMCTKQLEIPKARAIQISPDCSKIAVTNNKTTTIFDIQGDELKKSTILESTWYDDSCCPRGNMIAVTFGEEQILGHKQHRMKVRDFIENPNYSFVPYTSNTLPLMNNLPGFSSDDFRLISKCNTLNKDRDLTTWALAKRTFPNQDVRLCCGPNNAKILITTQERNNEVITYIFDQEKFDSISEKLRNRLTIRQVLLFKSIARAKEQREKVTLTDEGIQTFNAFDQMVQRILKPFVRTKEELEQELQMINDTKQTDAQKSAAKQELIQAINMAKKNNYTYGLSKREEAIFNTLEPAHKDELRQYVRTANDFVNACFNFDEDSDENGKDEIE